MSVTKTSDSTERSQDRRKLVAVVYADMVGYSRLIGLDDAGTLDRLRALRRDLIDPAIDVHSGTIVQTGGDSLLIVFDSIDGAVRCAVKVQQQVPSYDGHQPPDQAIRFRIGINIGDAIADGTDLHGDAVNVAARLQAECPPGGICLSRSVRDHVHGRLDLAFEELGSLTLKNIARPIEAFVLWPDMGATTPKPVERSLLQDAGEALPLPDKPSIAVLPFTNLSTDLEQEFFSDGIADDLITELSRSRSLLVIARNSSFSYRGTSVDMRQVARELRVRYLVEGSVRREERRVRINAQLIDAETSNYIWAERYDRGIESVFAVQDELTLAIITAIRPAVADAEYRRTLRRPPESLSAWEAYQRGLWHKSKLKLEDILQAREFFKQAAGLDPTFAVPHAELADLIVLEVIYFASRPLSDLKLAEEEAQIAVELDPSDASAHTILARSLANAGAFNLAFNHVDRALAIQPDSADALRMKGIMLVHNDRLGEGRELLARSMRMDPHDKFIANTQCFIGVSYFGEHKYESAIHSLREALGHRPTHIWSLQWLAASLGQLGRTREASDVLQKAALISPEAFDRHTCQRPPNFHPEHHERMLDGLRRAGWEG